MKSIFSTENIVGLVILLAVVVSVIGPTDLVQKIGWGREDDSLSQEQVQTASVLDSLKVTEDFEEMKEVYEITIENLEAKIEELKSQEPETKTIVKEVPIEKIVIKEVVKETICDPTVPNISSIQTIRGDGLISIKWKTDKYTKGKVVISGGDIVGEKEISSVFSSAKEHRVNFVDPTIQKTYYYQIYATTVERGKELGSATRQGSFYVAPLFEND